MVKLRLNGYEPRFIEVLRVERCKNQNVVSGASHEYADCAAAPNRGDHQEPIIEKWGGRVKYRVHTPGGDIWFYCDDCLRKACVLW